MLFLDFSHEAADGEGGLGAGLGDGDGEGEGEGDPEGQVPTAVHWPSLPH